MQLTIKKQIGRNSYTFIVEGANLAELVKEQTKLSFPDVPKCGCCGEDNLYLGHHEGVTAKKQKVEYTTIRCGNPKCKASINFGKRMDNPDAFYLRQREEGGKKIYDWRKQGEEYIEE